MGGATSGTDQEDNQEPTQREYSNTSSEIDIDDYSDDNFKHECPRCKFRFND